MAGFTLPKLRWLVLGAAAAGHLGDDPGRAAARRRPSSWQRERAKANLAHRPNARGPAARSQANRRRPRRRSDRPPALQPSEMTTSSIPRPEKPVGATAAGRKLFATSKVRMREKADTSAPSCRCCTRGQGHAAGAKRGSGAWSRSPGRQAGCTAILSGDVRQSAPSRARRARPKVPVTKSPAKASQRRDARQEPATPTGTPPAECGDERGAHSAAHDDRRARRRAATASVPTISC